MNMGKGRAVGLAPPDGRALFRGYEEYETGLVKGMEVGYEKGMVEGMEKGYEKGKSKGMKKGYEKGIEMGYEEGQAFDKGYFKGMGKGMEKGYGDGYDKGYEKGRGDGKSQGMEMGFEQGSERGYDRGYEKGLLALDQALEANEKGLLGEWLRQKSHWTRHSPPKSKRARRQWPRSPRPSSSEADLEAELEEKPSPKPRPRLSQLDSAKANKSEDTSKAITEVSPKDYEWLPEEDLYEPQEEYFRMLNEDFGIEYSTDKMLPEEYYLSPREEYFRMQDEDLRSRQRLLRGHNTDDTESTLEFGVNPSMQDEDVGAASTSAASKAKPKAASKGAPFTKARPLPKRVQTEAEERQFGAPRKCAQCHAPVKRPLAVNWCPKCKACIHTDCLEAHYVRRHGEPFDSSHPLASCLLRRHGEPFNSSHPPASCLLPPSMRPKPPASPPPTYLMKNADGQGKR